MMLRHARSNRYEIKYFLEMRRLPRFKQALKDFLVPDSNAGDDGGYYNYSVYFDSPGYNSYSEKHEGQQIRIKARIRLYRPMPNAVPTAIFLELKKRYDRTGYKFREKIDLNLADAFLSRGPERFDDIVLNSPVVSEFYFLRNRFRLVPSVTVLYHRTAYYSPLYPQVRVTFDRIIQCSLTTTLNNPSHTFTYVLPPTWLVIELKYIDKVPDLLLKRFNSFNLQQVTFSKFAASLERCHMGRSLFPFMQRHDPRIASP